MTDPLSQPRVRGNDWGALSPQPLGSWAPSLSLSVVVPAFGSPMLPHVLASLAGQSYPADLMEVVVVDDGSDPPIVLPELRPLHTRIVRVTSGWGRANACQQGAEVADGHVIHWLDADMLLSSEEVEAQMRWHHLLDHVVVLGQKTFVDPAERLPTPQEVHEAVQHRRAGDLFAGQWQGEHEWVERLWSRTSDLRSASFRAYQVHVGATASVSRDFFFHAGGMDAHLKLGEDIELGYRLGARGAVFVADREARSWHLGRSTLMQREEAVNRYNGPFLANRIPDLRKRRTLRGRTYRVPFLEVVVDATDQTWEDVKHTVDGVLNVLPGDLDCLLVGKWGVHTDQRRRPLDDRSMDVRLIEEEYATERRVALVGSVTDSAFPATFRVSVPAGWRPGEGSLSRIIREMQRTGQGLRSVLLADGAVVRFERTAAYERARRLAHPREELDDVVDQVSSTWWSNGEEEGFVHRTTSAVASPSDEDTVPETSAETPQPGQRSPMRRVARAAAARLRTKR